MKPLKPPQNREPRLTNNRMDMLACIETLKTLEGPSNVVLYSDSQLVIKCAMGAWKRTPRLVGSAQPIA
jgi:ribonuclease HI